MIGGWFKISKSSTPRRGRRGRGFLASCRGATAVEFAIVAPLFLTMMVGVFEVSRAMWIKASMQFAVEETARYVLVNTSKTAAELQSYAQTKLSEIGVDTTGMDFTSTTTDGTTVATIQVNYTFQTITSLLPFPSLTLTAKSRVPLS